ncbi:hypothetical protein Tco_0002950 [Tanacetum coccineum]
MATLNESLSQETSLGSGPMCQDNILGGAEAQIRFEAASKQSNDLPLSRVNTLGIDRVNPQEKVLDLEKAKTAQAKEIACLKKRTQERNDEEMLFDVQDDLRGKEVVAEKEVAEKEVSVADLITTAGEVVTTTNINELTCSDSNKDQNT